MSAWTYSIKCMTTSSNCNLKTSLKAKTLYSRSRRFAKEFSHETVFSLLKTTDVLRDSFPCKSLKQLAKNFLARRVETWDVRDLSSESLTATWINLIDNYLGIYKLPYSSFLRNLVLMNSIGYRVCIIPV